MLISIITVCFNSEKTIRDTIESVLNQTYGEVEYIVVDGLSKDNTVQIAREYERKFADKGYRYQIISEKDNGIYDAMNKGIRNASGEIVGIINSDDWYEPDALETVATTYRQTPFDMFYADIRIIRENGSSFIKHSRLEKHPSSRNCNHPTTFITKETYDECGLFSCKGFYDDYDLILRVRHVGKKIVIVNKVLANFRVGGVSNRKSLKACMARVKDRYRCYRDNGYSRLYYMECLATELAKLIIC